MRQSAIAFKSGNLTLEGVLSIPDELPQPYPALIACHPHPLLGGNMDNPVITAVCRAAAAMGLAALRFNYRGVEGSEGEFTNGKREAEDIQSALSLMRQWPGIDRKRLALVGYSFGAALILRELKRCKTAKSLVLIAPPASAVAASPIKRDKRPKLFIAGQNDRVAPPVALQRALDDVRQPVQFREIPAADHSLSGHEARAAELTADFLAATVGISLNL